MSGRLAEDLPSGHVEDLDGRAVGGADGDVAGSGVGVDGEYVRVKIGMPIIRWNASTYDAVTDYTLSRSRGVLTSTLTDTAVILAHNLAQHSGQNCDQLLSILQQRGYLTVTCDELFRIRGVQLMDNTVYTGDETGSPGWERAEAEALLARVYGPAGQPAPEAASPSPAPVQTPVPTLIPVGLPVPDEAEEPEPFLIPVATPRPE